jgi:hypothetical protein
VKEFSSYHPAVGSRFIVFPALCQDTFVP